MQSWSVLSNDLKICSVIYEYEHVKHEKIWFSKLVGILEGEISRATVSKTLDKLFDLGMIDGTWEKVEGKWTRVFRVTGEAEELIRTIYQSTKAPS